MTAYVAPAVDFVYDVVGKECTREGFPEAHDVRAAYPKDGDLPRLCSTTENGIAFARGRRPMK